jgi:hypothetical protein
MRPIDNLHAQAPPAGRTMLRPAAAGRDKIWPVACRCAGERNGDRVALSQADHFTRRHHGAAGARSQIRMTGRGRAWKTSAPTSSVARRTYARSHLPHSAVVANGSSGAKAKSRLSERLGLARTTESSRRFAARDVDADRAEIAVAQGSRFDLRMRRAQATAACASGVALVERG